MQIDGVRREIELARSRVRIWSNLKGPGTYRISTLKASIKEAVATFPVLEDDIAALDRVIAMHPHKVDLSQPKPVRERQPDLLPRGHLHSRPLADSHFRARA